MARGNQPQSYDKKLNEFLICKHLPLLLIHDFRGVSGHDSHN